MKKKARERFNDLVDPAINRLEKAINDDDVPTASAIAAAKDILDRAGYKPGFDLNLGGAVEINDPGRDKLTDDDLKKLIELLEAAEGDQE